MAPDGFPAASPRDRGAWGLCKKCPKKNLLGLTMGNDKGKNCYIVYYRFLKRSGQLVGQNLIKS